jgi:hypothetical protein
MKQRNHKQSLERRKKNLGNDHPDTLKSVSIDCNNDMVKLRNYFKRALEGREKLFGTDYPHTLVSLNNLGTAYSS